MTRILTFTIAMLVVITAATAAHAQTPFATVRVTSRALIFEGPRGDSLLLGSVTAGTSLQVIGRRVNWVQVLSPAGVTTWPRGWINIQFVEVVTGALPAAAEVGGNAGANTRQAAATPHTPNPNDRIHLRGFAQGGLMVFTARKSFTSILEDDWGPAIGGGVQVGVANHLFVEAGIAQFRKTGSRVFVSGNQLFRLHDVPDEVTVTPITVSFGYREAVSRTIAGYAGAGGGWYQLKESSPAIATLDEGHAGFQIMGGLEFAITRWLAIAAEARWATVPNALGDGGISEVLLEDNLGSGAYGVKIVIGR